MAIGICTAGEEGRLGGLSPQSMLVTGFAMLIVAGTVLLWLPIASAGPAISLLDALFTAASATCVTGLVTLDTGTAFSGFGQGVILMLIQAGGLGVMAFAALAFDLFGKRLSLRAQSAFNESLFQRDSVGGLRRRLLQIVWTVLLFEGVGGMVMLVGFARRYDLGRAAYLAAFHAVSAFCNAGFSLFSDSLMSAGGHPLVLLPVAVLVVAGGLGQPVLLDVWSVLRRCPGRRSRYQTLTLHSRIVLKSSLVLIVGGGAILFATGAGPDCLSGVPRVSAALFQSISARTAGFNTVDVGRLPLASLLVLAVLMFVGGSPGSCAGGIKTTTAMLWLAQFSSRIRGRKWPSLLGRHMPGELVRRASTLVGLAFLWNIVGTIILSVTEAHTPGAGLRDLVFEQLSAFGTVGLSTGVTAHLSALGQVWIVITMFVGRVGPLTLVVWVFEQRSPGVRLPEGKVMIG